MSDFLSHTAVVASIFLTPFGTTVSIRLVDGVLNVYYWSLASLESLVDILGLGVDMVNYRLTQDGTTYGRAMHGGSK
jgi:hypothetical protein